MTDYEKIQDEESAFSRGTMWGERVVDTVDLCENYIRGKVLDVGCNDGLAMDRIDEFGHEVVGIDISEAKASEAAQFGHTVFVGRMESMPFEDKEFDTVFCSHTLEHAEDLEEAAAELMRVGKRLIILVPIESRMRVVMLEMSGIPSNEAHYSPIEREQDLKDLFPGTVLYEESLLRFEPEYLLVVDL